jgi:hypothetical protein
LRSSFGGILAPVAMSQIANKSLRQAWWQDTTNALKQMAHYPPWQYVFLPENWFLAVL